VATLEEVTYDLARQALADQAREIEDLRGRSTSLVVAAVAVAGLLARPATEGDQGLRVLVAAMGFVAGLVVILAVAEVLRHRRFDFSVDAFALYRAAWDDRRHSARYYVRIASALRIARRDNEVMVAVVRRAHSLALGALVVEAVGLALATAVS